MIEVVTLAEAKAHLRVSDDDEDAVVAMMIGAATEAVLDVATDDAWTETSPVVVPDRLKLAVLARVAVMFDNRESLQPGAGELPMLTPLRTLEA